MPERKLNAEDLRVLYDRHGPALVQTPDVPVAYVYRAVRNAALNARRNGQRDAPLDANSTVFERRDGNREAALALQRALADLPEEQRVVVVMRVGSGMTREEVAAATGASLNTVASRYRYALEKLREKLQPYCKK